MIPIVLFQILRTLSRLGDEVWSLRSLLHLRSLDAVVDDILQHTLDLLDAEGFQELLQMQLISITQYNIRKNLSYLLEVNIFLHVIENIHDSLQRQKVACHNIL